MSSGQSGATTAAQRTAEKPTLAGASNRQRKRNQVIPFEPKKFVAGLLPCLEKGSLGEFAGRLDAAVKSEALDLKRYGDLFWDVIIAGGAVSSGGEIGDGENAINEASAFSAENDDEVRAVVELAMEILQRRPFLRPILEASFARLALFISSFSEEHVEKLAQTIGFFYGKNPQVPASFLVSLKQNDRLVERGHAHKFACRVMKIVHDESSLEKLVSSLKLAKIDKSIPDLFPTRERDPAEVQKYFSDHGLPSLAKFLQESKVRETLALAQQLMLDQESSPAEILSALKAEFATHGINNATAVSIIYKAVVASVPYSKRTGQHGQQFIDHVKSYAKCLAPYATTNRIQVDLLNRLQLECHERSGLNKSFLPVVQLLYNADVIGEDAVLIWHKGGPKVGTVSKGRNEAVEQLTPFVEWLEEASEEDSDEGED